MPIHFSAFGNSGWYKAPDCPVLCFNYFGEKNFTTIPNVDLDVTILNNGSKSLFSVQLETSFRTDENKWSAINRTDMGFLDIQQQKETKVFFPNPHLSLWNAQRSREIDRWNGYEPVYDHTEYENVTVYFLNITDYKITAYGFFKP